MTTEHALDIIQDILMIIVVAALGTLAVALPVAVYNDLIDALTTIMIVYYTLATLVLTTIAMIINAVMITLYRFTKR